MAPASAPDLVERELSSHHRRLASVTLGGFATNRDL
jgi:hypothetical protein